MDDLHFDETGHVPMPNSMHQHLQMKLGRPAEIQKTPSRGGLGMIVNESKTPGARSLQSLASSRKPTSSIVKNTVPQNIGFEIFQDETEEELVEEQKAPIKEIEKPPCSPIDTANRCQNHDSLCDDIADDALNWKDQDVILHDGQPLGDWIDPKVVEDEELAKLGVEPWDEYPPIDLASRIELDDYFIPLNPDDFKHESDVVLEEANYPFSFPKDEEPTLDRDEMKRIAENLLNLPDDYDSDDLLAELGAIPI
uniref:Securin n=1 Tax=Caenorhabditis tropicalis TaxID=1561998 RepID=A0A1I7TSL1_9PELO